MGPAKQAGLEEMGAVCISVTHALRARSEAFSLLPTDAFAFLPSVLAERLEVGGRRQGFLSTAEILCKILKEIPTTLFIF